MSPQELERRAIPILEEAAAELGLIGVFQKGKRHNKFRVVLPDETVVLMPIYCTPRAPDQYLATLGDRLKRTIAKNLERRGKL